MLKGLLENKICASCKICCGFDNTDLWEMPVMNEKTRRRLAELRPNVEFIEKDGGFVVDAGNLPDGELFYCPALDPEKGCMLGVDKPFDCFIWPFRIMSVDEGLLAITISPVCPEIYSRPLSQLMDFLSRGLEKTIYEYAGKHPEIIKPYEHDYPILSIKRLF